MLHQKVMNQSHEDLAKSGYTFFLQMWWYFLKVFPKNSPEYVAWGSIFI
jgi:hypothetical protein